MGTIGFGVRLQCRRKYNEAGMYDYARADYARMRAELGNVNWSELFAGRNIEQNWCQFTDLLLQVQHNFAHPSERERTERKCQYGCHIKQLKQSHIDGECTGSIETTRTRHASELIAWQRSSWKIAEDTLRANWPII